LSRHIHALFAGRGTRCARWANAAPVQNFVGKKICVTKNVCIFAMKIPLLPRSNFTGFRENIMELTGIKKWTVTVILMTLVDLSAWCQQIMRLSVEEGLSQGFVKSIVQDQSGFMWMGTVNGLNRYDGYDFKVYRREAGREHGLLSSTIGLLTMDEQKRLWVIQPEGIQYYDERVDGFITPPALNQAHYWRHDPQSCIASDQIILLTSDTLREFSYRTAQEAVEIKVSRTAPFPFESFGIPFCLFKDRDLLYIGTTEGVHAWDGREFRRVFPEVKPL
jgi:ligand-binding sensor domain-containing protein